MVPEFVPFEEGWSEVEVAIDKIKRILEGEPGLKFDFRDSTNLYTIIYNLCVQKFPHYYSVYSENFHYCDYSEKLYSRYRETIEDYCKQTVLRSLRKKHDENFLDELALRWSNHKCLIRWLSRGFSYIDRYYIMRRPLPTLNQVGLTCFHDLVYKEMQPRATEAVIALIHKEREGEEIDRALLKNILEMYVEIGMGHMDKYEDDFESSMLQDTESYYSSKASSWIKEDSCPEYMLKAEECLEKERERVTHYLRKSTEPKLLEKVENELLVVVAKQLIENEHSGCRALLRDGEMNDLSRMYRLYHKIPQALDTIVDIYKQHATAEAIFISKQFKEIAANPQVLLHKANMLYDQCLVCHSVCFKDSSARFEEVLKEAFQTFSISEDFPRRLIGGG